jgi:hypothetical protein
VEILKTLRSAFSVLLRCLCLLPCLLVTGCGTVGRSQMAQLQNENDRLLAEYRAQRDESTRLKESLAVAQARLAESEKLLARQNPIPSSRLSRLNDPTFGVANSTPNAVLPGANRSGLMDASPPGSSPSESPKALQWRPMANR